MCLPDNRSHGVGQSPERSERVNGSIERTGTGCRRWLLAGCILLAACGPDRDRNAVVCDDPDAFHSAYMGAPPPAEVSLPQKRTQQKLTTCNIEFINDKPLAERVDGIAGAGLIAIKGWFLDPRNGSVGAPLRLRLRDASGTRTWEVPIVERTPRQDIVAAFAANPAYLLAGFRVVFYAGQLKPGYYSVSLVIPGKGSEAVCGEGPVFGLR